MLAAKHPLRKGLTEDRARDILLVLTGRQQFQLLTAGDGWSSAEYTTWVIGAVLLELFGVD